MNEKRPDTIIMDDLEEPDTKSYHQVRINKVTNGFIIKVGCKDFVGENWEKISKQLGEYWKDPLAAEKKYCK